MDEGQATAAQSGNALVALDLGALGLAAKFLEHVSDLPAKPARSCWRARLWNATEQVRAAVRDLEGLFEALPADPEVSAACTAMLNETGARKRAEAVARVTRRNGRRADRLVPSCPMARCAAYAMEVSSSGSELWALAEVDPS